VSGGTFDRHWQPPERVSLSAQDLEWLRSLVDRRHPQFSLEAAFYNDPRVFERDVEQVFLRNWLLVGHASRIPRPGDYFLFSLADTSVIISRGAGGQIHALINVCRHRGSLVCTKADGNARSFVCPYHSWTYDSSGNLLSARYMPEGFDSAKHGLRQARVRVFQGLIFISFAAEPLDLEPAIADLAPYLGPHGLESARIARRAVYPLEANWKLAVENYLECYHCPGVHPEYCSVNPRTHTVGLPEIAAEDAEEMLAWIDRARALGHKVGGVGKEGLSVPPSQQDYGVSRVPLGRGFKTSSQDGEPLAPLMGTLKDYDGGQTYFAVGPVSYGVADCDHAIILRFTPLTALKTEVEMTWLVEGSAVEGKDYDRDRLLWMWDATIRQDQTIVNQHQEGVRSRFYRCGPYSRQETYVERWIEWYLAQIR